MKLIRFIISFIIILFYNDIVYGSNIKIKIKIYDKAVTNYDIEQEKKYLIFLNPNLKEVDQKRSNEIAKNSLITDIIKSKELEKYFDLNNNGKMTNIVEKNFLKRRNIKNKSEFLKILKNNELSYEVIKNKLTIEAMWSQYIYNKHIKNVKINKDVIRENILIQFKNNEKKYEYNLSEIIIAKDITENLEETLLNLKKSINEIGFENTANIFSVSNTSKNGGKIGWVNELQISKKINKNLKNLNINEISNLIEIPTGYLLIKLNNKKEFRETIDIEKEVEKLIKKETNRQLNNYSLIYFKRLKKNVKINEF